LTATHFGVVWILVHDTFTPLSLGTWKHGENEHRIILKEKKTKISFKKGRSEKTTHVKFGGSFFGFVSALRRAVSYLPVLVYRLSTLLSCTDFERTGYE